MFQVTVAFKNSHGTENIYIWVNVKYQADLSVGIS